MLEQTWLRLERVFTISLQLGETMRRIMQNFSILSMFYMQVCFRLEAFQYKTLEGAFTHANCAVHRGGVELPLGNLL